jgi:hypothetical protein
LRNVSNWGWNPSERVFPVMIETEIMCFNHNSVCNFLSSDEKSDGHGMKWFVTFLQPFRNSDFLPESAIDHQLSPMITFHWHSIVTLLLLLTSPITVTGFQFFNKKITKSDPSHSFVNGTISRRKSRHNSRGVGERDSQSVKDVTARAKKHI